MAEIGKRENKAGEFGHVDLSRFRNGVGMVVDQVVVDRAQEIGVQRPILIEEIEHFEEDKFPFGVKVVASLRRLAFLAVEVWIISFCV